ncbi:RagB/SusD family nutrient uptake outer membrane protein [Aquimarina sp. MMG016]|uniref:RagB/SusD family nutrient uptake outer membrane protein n=1 Tax=Aquimarina sp. MMG016 TaxID=2822690 RepID=UPI001B3A6723|nr:RagB/SusD family nutrient uptake outer membrane protein [Aquimarina sp. MMG016]MBQ4820825.1 RagB/SusD family nutrient uptake outer membrane protein [Aquimarina sp. MMG016]
MKKERLTSRILIALSVLLVVSCTDLEIEESDSLIADSETEFTGIENPEPFIENLYTGDLKGIIENQQDLYALNEVTTDELLVPTRGTDWGDNGIWRKLHEHTWDAQHPYVLNNWNNLNQLVFRASQIIDPRTVNAEDTERASARFIRAYAMFWVMDMYGIAPFRNPGDGPSITPMVMTRPEAFDFILEDLNTALPDLPTRGPSVDNLRPTKAAANFLLAKLYLNKHIYLGSGTPAASDMTKVVELVDAIAADGYALQSGYFDIFKSDVDTETIFFSISSVGNRMWNGLHYNQNGPGNSGGGWNGWSTLAEFYDLFEGDPNTNVMGSGQEERRGFVRTTGVPLPVGLDPDDFDNNRDGFLDGSSIGFGFLIGQQYDEAGNPLTDRTGNPLIFEKQFPALSGNTERTGIRTIKYHPENGAFEGHQILFRYADAHLMKAEAIFRGGTGSGDPLTMINDLRGIRNAGNLGALIEQDILDERGRELYKEFWRRNDLIRFGKFAEPWELKINNDDFRVLFPIPASALLTNSNLVQNPGY